MPTGTNEGAYEVIANAHGFALDIPGCPDASKNIREVHVDQTINDKRETTTGLDVEYRLFAPGATHWGEASFTSAVTLGASKELKTWFDECATGKNIRKNITVTLFKSDKTAGRSYNLFDCFPVKYSHGDFSTASATQQETIHVSIGRIEFKV